MRVTWVSGDNETQQVKYGGGKTQKSQVTTFTQQDMHGELLYYLYSLLCFNFQYLLLTF